MQSVQDRVFEIIKQVSGVKHLKHKTYLSDGLEMDSLLLTELEIELEIEFGIHLAGKLFSPGDQSLKSPIIPESDHTVGDVVNMVEEALQ